MKSKEKVFLNVAIKKNTIFELIGLFFSKKRCFIDRETLISYKIYRGAIYILNITDKKL